MGQGNSLLMCMSDSDDRKSDFRSFRAQKNIPGHTVHLINGVPHLSSPWPVSTDSSLYFSPSPLKFENEYIVSPFDIMSPSLSRENELTVVRLKELASLVQAGDLEDLNFVVSKWHLKYKDVRVDNTPLLHLAVSSNQFSMVKFLLSQDVDIDALDQDGMTAVDLAATCKNLSIYPYLKAATISGSQFNNSFHIESAKKEATAGLTTAGDDASIPSSSSVNSSYLSSMDVKKVPKKEQRNNNYHSSNIDGEESVDDDKSPRKGARDLRPSRLLSDQLLSPLSQSSTETTYSSILESENVVAPDDCDHVVCLTEIMDKSRNGSTKSCSLKKVVSDAEIIHESCDLQSCGVLIPESNEVKAVEPEVVFSGYQSPIISPESSMVSESSFVTAKTTSKSPAFRKMRKAAGRAFLFVARGEKKLKASSTKK